MTLEVDMLQDGSTARAGRTADATEISSEHYLEIMTVISLLSTDTASFSAAHSLSTTAAAPSAASGVYVPRWKRDANAKPEPYIR